MTDYKVTITQKPVCFVRRCDGSGWIDLGNGASLECDCREIGRKMEPQLNEWLAETIYKFTDKAFIEGIADAERRKTLKEGSHDNRD